MSGINEERPQQQANRQDTEEIFRISLLALKRDWDNELDEEYDALASLPPGDVSQLGCARDTVGNSRIPKQ